MGQQLTNLGGCDLTCKSHAATAVGPVEAVLFADRCGRVRTGYNGSSQSVHGFFSEELIRNAG